MGRRTVGRPGWEPGAVRISLCGEVDPVRRHGVGYVLVHRFPRAIEFGDRLEDIWDFGRVERSELRMRRPGKHAVEVVGVDAFARLFLFGGPEIHRYAGPIASHYLLSRGHIAVGF